MTTVLFLTATVLVMTGLFFAIRHFVRAYFRYRDSHIIICPDNKEQAMVEVDAMHAAMTSVLGQPDIRLQNCWRWPLHADCDQECLAQLHVAPEDSLVRGVLMRWYDSKSCVYCQKRFEQISLLEHKPALQIPDGRLLEWQDVRLQDLPVALTRYMPVCWDCYMAQSFMREHPDLVVSRPGREGIHRAG
jgi:hypothetical protein